jgi:glycosyltransferase involved in cell wall biosynthesis
VLTNIYHVIDSLGVGGAQSMLFELHEAIEKYLPQYRQHIILLNREKLAEGFVKSYGVDFRVLNTHDFGRLCRDLPEPSFIVYHKLMMSNTDVLRPAYNKLPIIVINHTQSDLVSHNKIRQCDHIVAVCNNMKQTLQKMGLQTPISVIHNGVNIEKYDKIDARERGYDDNVLLTGRINALNSIKYSDSWVKWCSNVHLPKKMVHEYMGGGSFLSQGKKLAATYQKSHNTVNFLGPVDKFAAKIEILKRWDFFLYEINRNEGLSIAILEALACGVPVICSNHYGNKEIIEDGVNGYVFKNRDEAASFLTDFCLDPQLIVDLKESTRKHFKEKLGGGALASRYGALFDKVISKRKSVYLETSPSVALKKKLRKRLDIEVGETPKSQKVSSQRDKENTFTILTAGYNAETFMDFWGASLIGQDYRPLKVVFIDDGSKDKTSRKLIELSDKFSQAGIDFSFFTNFKRQGCASAYARALQEAGDSAYYGILDADDMLMPGSVEYIVELYKQNPKIGYIYSQFEFHTKTMQPLKKGFSNAPGTRDSILDVEKTGKHIYSHWRTFSDRVPDIKTIFKPGLRSAVDKYMGYRLEELAPGMFADRICYRYRYGLNSSVSKTERVNETWQSVIDEAVKRRKKYDLTPYPIQSAKA